MTSEQKRAENRARFPELAAWAAANPEAKVLCIHDHAGALLWGKEPEPHRGFSAEFLTYCAAYGAKGKRK